MQKDILQTARQLTISTCDYNMLRQQTQVSLLDQECVNDDTIYFDVVTGNADSIH